ncbi:hypothetical protein J2Z58_000865 [Halobacillus andaensis]|nr:hypothetical protein [Halobacillus andaensis]
MVPSYLSGEKEQKKCRFPRGKTESLLDLRSPGPILSARPAGVVTFSVPFIKLGFETIV